jgi:NADPH-dependent ferric siderophore reductase
MCWSATRALPAIARRLEELPAGSRATALIEVAGPAEQRALASAAQLNLRWVPREDAAPGQRLLEAARDALPEGWVFAWAAGEALCMAALRAHWLAQGQPAALMRVAAYWRQGRPGHHENLG